jgi:acetolactate synthase-1/2/3 large subunit
MPPLASAPRCAGHILFDAPRSHGVDIFCVPGESYRDVLDALHDHPEIEIVVGKYEGAANMAEPPGKLTQHPTGLRSDFGAAFKL